MVSALPLNRLRQLALLLAWEGRLSRSRVMELFELSPVRASEWIRALREQRPRWMTWDSRARSYNATEAVYRAQRDGNDDLRTDDLVGLESYLSLAGVLSSHNDDGGVRTAFRDFSVPSAKIFATLRRAVDEKLTVEIQYRSMREPAAHSRLIEPHSMIRAGRRWHVRAYCDKNDDFRDYSLGRIGSAKLLEQSSVHALGEDTAWTTTVRVVIAAHPALSPPQADVVRFEYFRGSSSRVETSRAALVQYLIQDLRAATSPKTQKPPEYQLAVTNIEEVRPWLFPQ